MDFYSILGLSRGATPAEIRRAYRRLARRYHPGINPGDRAAEALFRRITEAYETLVDPRRRQEYDRTGQSAPPPGRQEGAGLEFAGFDFSVAAQGAQAATFTELFAEILHPGAAPGRARSEPRADLHAALTVTFEESFGGVDRQVVVTRQVPCGACRGAGHVPAPEGRCPHCQGRGTVRWARGHMVFSKDCVACGGTGRQRHQRCPACAGHGRTVRTEPVPVRVPAGTADGSRLRVAGLGHAGRHGGSDGDLYVTVHVRPHPLFTRQGDDVHVVVPVAVHEAVLGARIEIPSPEGAVKVRIPPGTQGGQRFRLRGRGFPNPAAQRGDLIVEARVVLPVVVDERSKELIREFGRLNSGDVRKDLLAQPSTAAEGQ